MSFGLTLHTTCRDHCIIIYDANYANDTFAGTIKGPLHNSNINFHARHPRGNHTLFEGLIDGDGDERNIAMFVYEQIDETTGLQCWEALIIMASIRYPSNSQTIGDKCRFIQFDDDIKGVHDG